MTNHLTPGAKALHPKWEIVECWIAPAPNAIRVDVKTYAGIRSVLVADLTPLLTAVVQEDGKVREVNWQGDEPDHPDGLLFADEDREQVYREYEEELSAWCIAEASRRTWPVDWKEHWSDDDGTWNFVHESFTNEAEALLVFPGSVVLGYVPAGKFIIVEIQTP